MNKIKLMSIFSVILLLLHFPVSVYATFNDYMLNEIHQGKSLRAWLYDEGENAISQQINATPQVDGSLGVDVGDSVSFSVNIPTYALVADRGGWIPALTGGKSGNTPVPNYFYTQMRYGKSPNLPGNFSIGEVTATNLPSGVTISRVVGPTTGNLTRVDVTVTRSQVSAANGHTNSINLNLSSLYLDTWAIDPTTADFFGNNPINVGGITLTNLNLGTLSLRTKNSIRVRYIDEAGNELRDPLVEQMEVGQNYAYTPPAIPGYTYNRLSSGSASASGQMAAGPERLVEFVYTKNPTLGGAVTVNHEFIGASSMNSSERFTNVGNVGDRFELTPRTEAGWQVKGELPEVIVTEQAQTVTIQYERKPGGAITVNHEFIGDSSMNTNEVITDVGNVGDRFEMTPRTEAGWQVKGELPEVIVTEQAQTVTIQYERKPGGAITVNHEFIGDSSMNTNEVITDVGNVGDRFELMPRTEAGWQVKGELPEVIVTEQAQTVTIQYERKPGGAITVNHEFIGDSSMNTNEVITDVGNVGDRFELMPRTEAGWQVKGELPEVIVTEQAQTVTIQYERKPGGAITVNHEFIGDSSMNTNEVITDVGNVGDRFELTPRTEAGWQVKGELPEVIVTEQAQTVTIQYERKPGGAITVNHEFIGDSSMNTNEVITDVGNVGDRFELMPRTEAGWQVKGELPEVIVTEQAQTVTIQYERKVGGQVVVNHIFEEAPEKNRMDILLGRWGEAFKAEPMQIAGWEVKETIGQPTGVFTDEEQEINFIYVRNEEQPIPEEDKPNDNKDKHPETKPVDQTTDKKTSTKKNDGVAIRRKEEKRSLPRLNSQAGISLTVVGTSMVAFVFWKQLKKRTKCKNK
ncbi:MucBP domain-containing protein [Enterococcus mundtii]|uniref:MucBP domain-containing protein n=1 Tax=Enterococcus mundtii TaxID=53346 RepID=UPI000E027DFD|nr:MucBP domain-containing protein [Enterococcus mundtii]STD23764.1 LPXTG-domain-containing protein cell wall anchor domain protein [Enterococcus mundtii]